MDAPDRHNEQRDKRTDGWTKRRVSLSVRPFVSQMEFNTMYSDSLCFHPIPNVGIVVSVMSCQYA